MDIYISRILLFSRKNRSFAKLLDSLAFEFVNLQRGQIILNIYYLHLCLYILVFTLLHELPNLFQVFLVKIVFKMSIKNQI